MHSNKMQHRAAGKKCNVTRHSKLKPARCRGGGSRSGTSEIETTTTRCGRSFRRRSKPEASSGRISSGGWASKKTARPLASWLGRTSAEIEPACSWSDGRCLPYCRWLWGTNSAPGGTNTTRARLRQQLGKRPDNDTLTPEDARTELRETDVTYDLFAVSNHLGSMAGGHYTSFCRGVPCRPDGTEEAAASTPCDSQGKSQYPWLHFDDQFVEEVAPERIQTGAAYVLFYRRRHLTAANVVRMTT